MSHVLTIAKRELSSFFYSPIAYVVLALFGAITALIFMLYFGPGAPATLRDTYGWLVWIMMLLVPAISMRLLSEEQRTGTIELLMTAPVSDAQVVVGKWLGALGFFLALLLPVLVLVGVLEAYGRPDYGPILTGLAGLILVGAFYLAIGAFASALSENQIICFLLTVFIIGLLTVAMYFLARASFVTPGLRTAFLYLNVDEQFKDFNKGLIDLSNFVYFLSGIGVFLFIAVKLQESRRWR